MRVAKAKALLQPLDCAVGFSGLQMCLKALDLLAIKNNLK
jgi:hypothetical protein